MSEAPRASDVDFAADLDVPIRPRGVTVSTLDSESSDRGSNPREAFYNSRLSCTAQEQCSAIANLYF